MKGDQIGTLTAHPSLQELSLSNWTWFSCVTSQILDVPRVRRQLRPVRGMHRLRTVSPWTAPTGRCPWLGIASRARQRWACRPPLVVRAVARSAVASKSVRSGMGMANLLVRRLESPQADQTPTNRSFRDLWNGPPLSSGSVRLSGSRKEGADHANRGAWD